VNFCLIFIKLERKYPRTRRNIRICIIKGVRKINMDILQYRLNWINSEVEGPPFPEEEQNMDDEIKQLEEKLRQMKIDKQIKDVAGGKETPKELVSIVWDPNKFRLEKQKGKFVLVEIVEQIDENKETEFDSNYITNLKKGDK